MRTKLLFTSLIITTLLITSCEEKSIVKSDSVENYIAQLKANKYSSDNLPSLTYQDIPFLLESRNDEQVITNFPRNLISSYYQPECTVGMYALWTIESIRAVSINSQFLMQRFPSQNPLLTLRNSSEFKPVSDSASRLTAAQAYYDWWTKNKPQDFSTFKNVDPLTDTDYKWH